MFGNVNVDYKPCKTVKQLTRACNYILGRNPEQIQQGVVKTASNLYFAFDGNRDNFAEDILLTRRLFGKPCNRKNNLAYKMSISFHPDDNEHLTYEQAFQIAKEFAEKYFHSRGFDVLFAVHTDTEHIHAHFIIGNCNRDTGKAFRRNQRDLYEMSEFFGQQCEKHGLTYSVRETFYSENPCQQKEKFGEIQMEKKGKESFKSELREVIEIECADTKNQTLEDVVNALMKHYNVECRVRGNTISYRHPQYKNKSGQLVSVRGSKLGEKYTVKGIEYELAKKRGQELAGFAERNDESCLYESGESRRSQTRQRSGDSAHNGAENVRDSAELYAEYADKVRRTEREAAETSERAKRVRRKRSEIGI